MTMAIKERTVGKHLTKAMPEVFTLVLEADDGTIHVQFDTNADSATVSKLDKEVSRTIQRWYPKTTYKLERVPF